MSTPIRDAAGVRPLTPAEAELVSEIRAHAEATRQLVQRVMLQVEATAGQPPQAADGPATMISHPLRWVDIGCGQLQQGYMALTRAVTAPAGF